MKVQRPRRSASDIKMRSLMNSLNGCGNLKYVQQPTTLSSGYDFEDSIDLSAFNIEKIQFLKDIIALADVARSKIFTKDTFERELISDIFTEIFIKAKGLQNYEYYSPIPQSVKKDFNGCIIDEERFNDNFIKANAKCFEDVTDEVNRSIEEFELKNIESLRARSTRTRRDSEIRLIQADVNEFILRLGDMDYYIRLLGREFIFNGIVSDSITFDEKVV